MTSKLLRKAHAEGREIVSVTPEEAGWKHVGFRALRLRAGERESLTTGDRELCIVALSGNVDVEVDGVVHVGMGTRTSVFDDAAPGAIYVPGDGVIDFEAVLRLLRDGRYEGWLVVEAEQDPAVAPSYEYAKKGYDTLRELDWPGYRSRYGDIQRLDLILEAENDSPNRYKLSKQADVVMLFYLFSDRKSVV